MIKIGLIREGKIPSDNRVAFIPAQCKWIQENKNIEIIVQHSASRCYTDDEYLKKEIQVKEDISECDIFLGIKEVPVNDLIPAKTYLFFSHTKKLQANNQKLLQAILQKKLP
jgi:hypothetical protein